MTGGGLGAKGFLVPWDRLPAQSAVAGLADDGNVGIMVIDLDAEIAEMRASRREKSFLQLDAQGVVNGQVQLLDFQHGVRGHPDNHIGERRKQPATSAG